MRIVHKRRKHNPALTVADRQKIERREKRIERVLARYPDDYRRELKVNGLRDEVTAIIRLAEKIYEATRARQVAVINAKREHRKILWDRRTKEYKAMVKARESGVDIQAAASVAPALEQTNVDPALAAVRASIRADAVAAGVDSRELAP